MDKKRVDIAKSEADSRIKSAISRIPLLKNTTKIIPIDGGLTNMNLRIDTEENSYFMRLSEPGSEFLCIDRKNEKINTERAHIAGVGPELIAWLEEEKILLVRWLDAKTLHIEDFHSHPSIFDKITFAIRKLHLGPNFEGRFDFPALRKNYLSRALSSNYFIPEGYCEMESKIIALEKIIASNPELLVPCNNDLLAENFMDDGLKIWIIDYEYSGQNEASFEIGNLTSEISFSQTEIEMFCESYWGEKIPAKVYRAMAWSLIARYGWVMWASIQEFISPIQFDFRTWGLKKWHSVLEDMTNGHYENLLKNLKETN
ncbi:MAG: LPS biosynthesis choline kinase [Bacteroidetes bacterium]|nr:MAG: LPS biosynthesis choline kinase [Bacteroidota bacterium]